MTESGNWFLTRWHRHWKRSPTIGGGQAKYRKPVTTSITIDDPYQLPEGGWICLVWRGLKVFPCAGPSRPEVMAVANKLACALALHISKESVLRDVACQIANLRLE